ncbi:MAG: hypothetical protein ACLGJC_09105 [Alphaproteobacteria bacterium]
MNNIAVTADTNDLLKKLSDAKTGAQAKERAYSNKTLSKELIDAEEKASTRAMAATWLVRGYVCLIAICILFIAIEVYSGRIKDGWPIILDLIKTAVLPIATFVIGHYFASNK